MVKAVVALGHFPIDLTATGVMERDASEAVERHVGRSDYLILIIERGQAKRTEAPCRIQSSRTCTSWAGSA